jgi:signal transduction histidine kinase
MEGTTEKPEIEQEESAAVLIVDDRKENLYVLERTLRETGARFVKAADGNEALKETLHNDFALAILDVDMPEMDGYELADHLRSVEKTKRLPILFLSAAYSDEHHIFRGYEAGAVDFIIKPYNPEILVNKVKVFLQLHRVQQELRNARDHLELRVKERTAELLKANEALQVEIREREQAEARLEKTLEELKKSNADLQEFAYTASHDLQEPLRKIQVFGDRVITEYGERLDASGCNYVERMRNAARRMQELINALLTYSRLTKKAGTFNSITLEKPVREALWNVEERVRQTRGRVAVSGLPTIEADPVQMTQLFQNLLSNALKFHSNGRSPEVRISGEVLPEDHCRIVVEDNGIGFDEKYLPQIFSPFRTLHKLDAYEGTGIGLTICRKIVERHGGKITARSTPGKGSTFIIDLPVKQKEREIRHEPAHEKTQVRPRRRTS